MTDATETPETPETPESPRPSGRAGPLLVGMLVGAIVTCAGLYALFRETADALFGPVSAANDTMATKTIDPTENDPDDRTDEIAMWKSEVEMRDGRLESNQLLIEELKARAASDAEECAAAVGEVVALRASLTEWKARFEQATALRVAGDKASLALRASLDKVTERLAYFQSKYGQDRSELLERIEELEARIAESDEAVFAAKLKGLEARSFIPIGVVVHVEKSKYGTKLAIRTSIDAARVVGQGVIRSPDGNLTAVVSFNIGRDAALSGRVLFEQRASTVTVGDAVFSRLSK